jgi:hypothetical protein
MEITCSANRQAEGLRSVSLSILTPRIWKLMIAGAYPALLFSAQYFEALERTGRMGAYIADTFFPATLIGYVALIFVLKKRAL